MTANKNIPKDLSTCGGAYNGALVDSAVQEYDLRDAASCCAAGTRSITSRCSQSEATLPTNGFPWDAYHVNSIAAGGRRAGSSSRCATRGRRTSSTPPRGKIDWTLGGRKSSFRFGPKAGFEWQHDVQLQPDGGRHALRRPLLPADRRWHLRRRRPGASRGLVLQLDQERAHGIARGAATASTKASNRNTWATPSRSRTATCSSAGARNAYFSEYDRAGQAALRRHPARAERHLPRAARAVGRTAADEAGRGRAPRRRGGRRSTRAGTAPRSCARGRCWPPPARAR